MVISSVKKMVIKLFCFIFREISSSIVKKFIEGSSSIVIEFEHICWDLF